ncbi:MAG: pyridoxamine 5'-phosphate oxidase family protein [Parvibaculaceae bacterium]
MDSERTHSSDIGFTPTVKAIQMRKGSRSPGGGMEIDGAWQTYVTPPLASFLAEQRSAFLATVNAEGQPYIQHRGGPPGFLKALDEKTIAFADFAGNRQYITQGNLADNPKAFLFLIDYMRRRRIKVWGQARVVEGDPELVRRLMPEGYRARPEQAILFTVQAWDVNCQQHIPQRFDAEDVAAALEKRDRRIAELEAELARLKGAVPETHVGPASS